jgi:hypothetical protein
MAAIAADEIPSILSARGWVPRAIDKRTWRCTVATGAGNVRVVVRHAGSWLYLAVIPFLEPDSVKPWGGGKYPSRFLGRILAVNSNLSMVKFALDDDGDLTLRVELPTESLQSREVDTALALLATTTEQYRAPIRDALLDAGRAAERASVLPEVTPPTHSEPPGEPDGVVGDGVLGDPVIAVSDASLTEPEEGPLALDAAARTAPLRSDPPPPKE